MSGSARAFAAALALACCSAAFAQTATDDRDRQDRLNLSGNRQNIGEMSVAAGRFDPPYASPPGSGAATTGFVSQKKKNTKGAKKKQATKNAEPAIPPAQVNRNPGLLRVQQQNAAADVTGSIVQRPRRRAVPEDEPFAPIGFRSGTFILRPSIDVDYGYDTNATRVANGQGSSLSVATAQLLAASDWSRHQLTLDMRGSYTHYFDIEGLNWPDLQANLRGRIDVTRDSRIEVDGKFALRTENPGSPNLTASVAELPNIYTFGVGAAYVQRFNRLELTAGTAFERNVYDNAKLTNGTVADLSDRDYNQYSLRLRAAYEWSPDVMPFIETVVDKRERDLAVDFTGIQRDSEGALVRAGFTFGRKEVLSGEISAGYAIRTYADPSLNDIQGVIVDSSLIWRATGLTTVRLNATSAIDETIVPGAAGVLRREARLVVEHAFRRWLIASASLGYTIEDYHGSGLVNDYLRTSVALTYFLNRTLALKAEYRHEQLFSSVPGSDYTANIGLIGIRLQR